MSLAREEIAATIEDIYNLTEGQRAELIDGQLYMLASPSDPHQAILFEIVLNIGIYIRGKKGNCKVRTAPYAVFLNGDESEYFEPDISIICKPDLIKKGGCFGAPDWIIEITSPSTASKDYLIKSAKYEAAGVREYWIVDTKNESVTVYFFENDPKPTVYTLKDNIKTNIYEDLYIDFNKFEI